MNRQSNCELAALCHVASRPLRTQGLVAGKTAFKNYKYVYLQRLRNEMPNPDAMMRGGSRGVRQHDGFAQAPASCKQAARTSATRHWAGSSKVEFGGKVT